MRKRSAYNNKRRQEELIRCGSDVVYFLKNYAKIVTLSGGTVDFDLFPFQEELLDIFQRKNRTVILKARQMGISTVTAGYVTWKIIFEANQSVVIVATDRETARELMDKVKKILLELPDWLKDVLDIRKWVKNNDREIVLRNESKIVAAAKGVDAVRGKAINLLVIDEAAFIANSDKVWTTAQPTLSTGGDCIVLSTPNGVGGWFYDTYQGAALGPQHPDGNNFEPYELLWDKHPDRDESWYDETMKSLNNDTKKFAQEFGCSFEASGDTVIAGEIIKSIKNETVIPPMAKRGFDGNFWVWKDYDVRKDYLIVADVARGDGEDYSAAWVVDLSNFEHVASYKGQVTTDGFADFLEQIGYEYGECPLVVENTGIGYAVIQDLRKKEYPNLWYTEKGSHKRVEAWKAERKVNGRNEVKSGIVAGITASVKTRPIFVDKLIQFLNGKKITIRDMRAIEELQTYIWLRGKPSAQKGKNDDLVSSLSILCWILDENFKVNESSVDTYIGMLKGIKKSQPAKTVRTQRQLEDTGSKKRNFSYLGIYKG